MILKSDAKFEEKLICCFKNNKALVSQPMKCLCLQTKY